jgi:hypothetical protein
MITVLALIFVYAQVIGRAMRERALVREEVVFWACVDPGRK